jgi:hypothetical protein
MTTIYIHRTKKGLPALWESGGGYSNTGEAQLITGPKGEKEKPIYIRRRGSLACEDHALFVVKVGDLVIQSFHHRKDFEHKIYQIIAIREDEADLKLLAEYSEGQWDAGDLGQKLELDLARLPEEPLMDLTKAIIAAEAKAKDYHCREPYYLIDPS